MPLRPPAGFVSANYDPLKNSNPPTSPAASAGSQTASVSFTAPTNTGGGAITNYYAVSNPGQIVASSVTSPISVTGLTNGTEYTFKVWAENPYGPSAYSAPTNAVTPAEFYIEDVFSTYLYAGTSANQTITNGVDLSNKGGMVWIKARDLVVNHVVFDSARGEGPTGNYAQLFPNSTVGQTADPNNGISSFNVNGFSLTSNETTSNRTGYNYVSWTFRKQAKFFDVVTYTGTGVTRTVSHNLGSTPGCIFVKKVSGTSTYGWCVYHRSCSSTFNLLLNSADSQGNIFNGEITSPTSTTFTVSSNSDVNGNNETYVAYLFAHDAGGFGATGTDNVISCGSYAGNGSSTGPVITLGYEVQWVLIKKLNSPGEDWMVLDVMRGMSLSSGFYLRPNATGAEVNAGQSLVAPTATGFQITADLNWPQLNTSGQTYAYVAIRRGPMKTPTSGTSVFTPVVRTGTNGTTSYSSLSFSPDLVIGKARQNTYSPAPTYTDKLRGTNRQLGSSSTNAETTASDAITGWLNTGYNLGADNSLGNYNLSTTSNNYVTWNFSRAPGFFDVVCYTGTGVARTVSHNLGVAPELLIIKKRNASGTEWATYTAPTGNTQFLNLNSTAAAASSSPSSGYWNNTTPTSTVFSLGNWNDVNQSGATFVAYLFATVAGVSKVGSYTGTGNSGLQINCGFTNGARFILIKRINGLGSWYVFDTARGIVAGNDARLEFNSTDAEASVDWIDPYSPGFEIASTLDVINTSGGTYLYLAIA